MFCRNCGAELPDGAKFCTKCGAQLGDSAANVSQSNSGQPSTGQSNVGQANANPSNGQSGTETVDRVYNAINDEIKGIGNSISGNNTGSNGQGGLLKTDRNILVYILFSVVTCGIYGIYYLYTLVTDINIICQGDGEEPYNFVKTLLLTWVTCGIYGFYWYYKFGNRMQANAPRYGLAFQENGTTIVLWMTFGALLCGVGSFVAMYIIIKNMNALSEAYNRTVS